MSWQTGSPPIPERARHAYGRSYRDVVRAFRGRFDHPPDLVAHPRDEADVVAILEWAVRTGAAVIPFGGGTSVVGGVEPLASDHGYRGRRDDGPQGTYRAFSRSTPRLAVGVDPRRRDSDPGSRMLRDHGRRCA